MRKALQLLLGLFGITVIFIALLHIIFGPAVIPGSMPVNATMDSEDRFFATLFLAFGIVLLWCIKDVERKANVVYFLMLTFFAGGIARLISIAAVGLPDDFFIAMTILELLMPFVYVYLQYRVSDGSAGIP
ncbi:MAG: DUF4345 domain-containing protein [Pseudomonadales bacterium]